MANNERESKGKTFFKAAGNAVLGGVFTGIGMTGVGLAANAIGGAIKGKGTETFIKGASATGFFGGTGMFF